MPQDQNIIRRLQEAEAKLTTLKAATFLSVEKLAQELRKHYAAPVSAIDPERETHADLLEIPANSKAVVVSSTHLVNKAKRAILSFIGSPNDPKSALAPDKSTSTVNQYASRRSYL